MDFLLSDDQQAVREMARRYANERLLPGIREREETIAAGGPWPDLGRERAGLFELGFAGMLLPEDEGGMGLDHLSFHLAVEELSRVDPSMGQLISNHNALGVGWMRHAEPRLRQAWLPRLAAGQALAAWTRMDDIRQPLKAEETPRGLRLNGAKRMVTAGAIGDLLLVSATLAGRRIVLGMPAHMPGVTQEREPLSLGLRGAGIGRVSFTDVEVDEDHRLDTRISGKGLMLVRATASLGWASVALGIMEGAADLAQQYAAQREQFGRRIDSFEAIRFKLADMQWKMEATRGLALRAAIAADAGQPTEFARLADLARLAGAEGASFCGREVVQIHGGYGYSREYHAERFMRDARGMEMVGGGVEGLREQIAERWIGESAATA
ncbi:MAG: acyl-CoA dehydrogenase family protein [bacterium]|jgi:alkylation response protein AidB-like acyl-CoA dehydrogenase|nr:acyl-CoA dehydrogenase family protein [bacterium]